VTDESGNVYAYFAQGLHSLWRLATGIHARTDDSRLAVIGNTLFVDSNPKVFYAVDVRTRRVLWRSSAARFNLDFATDGARVYVTARSARRPSSPAFLLALNARTGKVVWTFRSRFGMAKPAIANGVVFVSNDGPGTASGFFALDARTGRKLWSAVGSGAHPTYPAIAGRVVFLSDRAYGLP